MTNNLIIAAISCYLATLGFAVLFNIRGRKVWAAAGGGALGGVVYVFLINAKYDAVFAMFVSSLCFSFYSEVCARYYHSPVTTFVVCALLPLVPGGGMYEAMVQVVQGNIDQALTVGVDALSKAGALALGVITISTLTRLYFQIRGKRKKLNLK